MKTSEKGMIEILGHEGICLTKYIDSVGVQTIGAGATVTEIKDIANWPWDKKLSMQEVIDLFKKSLKKYEDAINKNLTSTINQWQFDALVSWAYNCGGGWAKTATVMKLVNQHADNSSIYNALMLYNKPKEIIKRREKEALLLTRGVYSNGGKVLVFPVDSRTHKPMYSKGYQIDATALISGAAPSEPVKEITPSVQSTTHWQGIWNAVKDIFKK